MTDWKRNLQLENKNKQRLFGMLGFAMRAGKITVGTDLVCLAMANGTVKLTVVSKTASDATKKKLFVKSEFYGIPAVEVDIDTEHLGNLLGKTFAVAALGVSDDGFAAEIKKATL